MKDYRLTVPQRNALDRLAKASADTREARRASALLDLDGGDTITAIAGRYGVSRQTVYHWAARPTDRLSDAPRSGRPADTRQAAERLLLAALSEAPREHGYRSAVWTLPLLQHHLRRQGAEASEATIRRALHGLGYRGKRSGLVPPRPAPRRRAGELSHAG